MLWLPDGATLPLMTAPKLNSYLESVKAKAFYHQRIQMPKHQWRASPLLVAGHRQVISRIRMDSQNILVYNFIVTTKAEVFLPGHLLWHVLVWRRHCETLAREADDRLVKAVLLDPNHVLRKHFPETRATNYNLLPRTHEFKLSLKE